MEEPEIGAGELSVEAPSLSFPPHRRSHLKSETYRTLVHILSHCYGQSEVSLVTPISLGTDHNGTEAPPATENDFVGPDGKETESLSSEGGRITGKNSSDGRLCHARMVLDRVGNIMEISENQDALNQKDTTFDDIADLNGLQDGVPDRQQMLMNELELIMSRNEELVPENCTNLLSMPLEKNQSHNDTVASLDNKDKQCDLGHIVVDRPQNASEIERQCAQKVLDVVDLSLEEGAAYKGLTVVERNKDQISVEEAHETDLKDIETEKVTGTHGMLPSNTSMLEEGEIEVEKLSGDSEIDDESTEMMITGSVCVEEMNGKHVSDEIIDKKELPRDEEIVANNGNPKFNCLGSGPSDVNGISEMAISGVNEAGKVGDRYNFNNGNDKNERKNGGGGGESAFTSGQVLDQETVPQSDTERQGISPEEKTHADVSCKRKRGAGSKERRAKKKQKERRERAEKNRQLGVKRLKLRPILKPKPVVHCRHYLNGRCHEGERCKFSHDTTPLTKSKPCCYFARQECMKGSDCPYDHDLSKYPCHKYETTGFCSRGDNCIFSHKVPLTNNAPSATDAGKSERAIPTLSGVSYTKEQPNMSATTHQNVGARSFLCQLAPQKSSQPNVTEAPPQFPVFPARHSTQLSTVKQSTLPSKPIQEGLSQKVNGSGCSETQSNQITHAVPMRKPVAPQSKVLYSLSSGKGSPEDWSGKRLATPRVGPKDGAQSSPLKNFTSYEQAHATGANPFRPGYHTTQSISSAHQNSNEMPIRKTLPAMMPKGMSFLSFGTGLACDSQNTKQPTSASGPDNLTPPNKHQTPSTRPTTSVFMSSQSSEKLILDPLKGTPNSAQKTLMSALAFAARIEADKANTSGSDRGTANCSEKQNRNFIGSSSSNSKKIYEFLSSFSNKAKQ